MRGISVLDCPAANVASVAWFLSTPMAPCGVEIQLRLSRASKIALYLEQSHTIATRQALKAGFTFPAFSTERSVLSVARF